MTGSTNASVRWGLTAIAFTALGALAGWHAAMRSMDVAPVSEAKVEPAVPAVVHDLDGPSWVEGEVVDRLTGEPLFGLRVSVDEREYWANPTDEVLVAHGQALDECHCTDVWETTGSDGRFCVDGTVPSPSMRLMFHEAGLAPHAEVGHARVTPPHAGTIELTIGPTLSFVTRRRSVSADWTVRVAGRVDGNPTVAEARVRDFSGPSGGPWVRLPAVVTEFDGSPPWQGSATSSRDHRVAVFEVTRRSGIEPEPIELRWVDAASLFVRWEDIVPAPSFTETPRVVQLRRRGGPPLTSDFERLVEAGAVFTRQRMTLKKYSDAWALDSGRLVPGVYEWIAEHGEHVSIGEIDVPAGEVTKLVLEGPTDPSAIGVKSAGG